MTATRYQVRERGPLLEGLRRRVRRFLRPARRREDLHRYWREPDERNAPETYLADSAHARSEMLVELVGSLVGSDDSILELGCNAGRNLSFLHRAGFSNLSAIEISSNALRELRGRFGEIAPSWKLHNEPLEEALPKLADDSYQLVFTMAVLEHLHTESEDVFDEIARVASRHLITVEDEHKLSWRHFPRNYRHEFERRGLRQLQSFRCEPERHGLSDVHVVRIFATNSVID